MGLELGNPNTWKWNRVTNKWECYQKPIRELIVNDSEKFRLEIKGKLMYAKGKVNFDFNHIKDGAGDSLQDEPHHYNHFYNTYFEERVGSDFTIIAFYNDGFYKYTKTNNKYIKYKDNELSTVTGISKDKGEKERTKRYWWYGADFLGWYTEKEGGVEIKDLEDLSKRTSLFKYSEDSKLPEITLYAHWNLWTFKITVHNITKNNPNNFREQVRSSFKYNQKIIEENIKTFSIPYGTYLKEWLDTNITDVKYQTWARDALDGTQYEKTLRACPQKFLGWTAACKSDISYSNRPSASEGWGGDKNYPGGNRPHKIRYANPSSRNFFLGINYATGTNLETVIDSVLINDYTYVSDDLDIYPQFQTLIIFQRNQYFGGSIRLLDNIPKETSTFNFWHSSNGKSWIVPTQGAESNYKWQWKKDYPNMSGFYEIPLSSSIILRMDG